jgi:hypothetical protein
MIGKEEEEEEAVVVVAAAANSWKHEWQLVQPNHTAMLLCGRFVYDATPRLRAATHTHSMQSEWTAIGGAAGRVCPPP